MGVRMAVVVNPGECDNDSDKGDNDAFHNHPKYAKGKDDAQNDIITTLIIMFDLTMQNNNC